MLELILSGGQVGADLAGVIMAKKMAFLLVVLCLKVLRIN